MSELISEHFPNATIINTFIGNDGTVYLLDNDVVVKILQKSSWSGPENIKNEAIVQSAAHELGLAPEVYFYDEKQGLMAMKYIDGLTLDEYLEKNPNNFAEIKKKIKKTLDVVYDHGIIHGDLAGSNIIIDKHGKIQLIDFSAGSLKSEPISEKKRDYYITGKMEKFHFGTRKKRRSKSKSKSKKRTKRSKRSKRRSKKQSS